MHQTLFYIPLQLAGVPVFGFGLLLALWIAGSIILLLWLARRQGFNADTWGYVPLLLMVAAILLWVLPVVCEDNRGLPIRGYGVMMLIAVLSATGLAVWRARRAGLNSDAILTLAFWAFVPGIVGARAFFVIQKWSELYQPYWEKGTLRLLGEVVNLSKGGLVVYGAFLGAMLGIVLFIRKYRLPLLATCDLIAPSMVLGLALGRIGCLMNGCCFGDVCDYPWAVTFPKGSPPYESQVARGQICGFLLGVGPGDEVGRREWTVESVEPGSAAAEAGLRRGDQVLRINGVELSQSRPGPYRVLMETFESQRPVVLETKDRGQIVIPTIAQPERSLPVHPAQIYGSINAMLLCLLLLAFDPFCRRDGELSAILLTLYPVARFLLEMIRTDEPKQFLGMTISQNVSLLMLLCAAGLWWYVLRRPKRRIKDEG